MRLPDGTLYFDANATTPEERAVSEAVTHAARHAFANPSSPHGPGRTARAALDQARAEVAGLCGCLPSEIVFCGSATEANFLALRSAASGAPGRGRILASGFEHPSVLAALESLQREGWTVQLLAVTRAGQLDLSALEEALGPDVAAVSLMAAHNETGVVQPVRKAAELCRASGARFHTDAVQLLGKLPSPWREAAPDFMTLAGHKLYGPKGIAALCVREGAPVSPLLSGGGQEAGRRASTEAVPLAVGLGVACKMATAALSGTAALTALRDRFETLALLPLGAIIHGLEAPRLPNTSYFSLSGASGNDIAGGLDGLGIAVGTGSACHAGSQELPRVLQWMGVEEAAGTVPVRISLCRHTTAEEIETLTGALLKTVGELLAPDEVADELAHELNDTEKLFVFICKGDACTKKGNPDRAKVTLKQLAREYPAQSLKVSFVSCLGMCGEAPNILLCKGGKILSRCDHAKLDALEEAIRSALGDAP